MQWKHQNIWDWEAEEIVFWGLSIQKTCNAQLRRQHCRADVVSGQWLKDFCAMLHFVVWLSLQSPPKKLNPDCLSSVHGASHEDWKHFWRLQNVLGKCWARHSTERDTPGSSNKNVMHFLPHSFIFLLRMKSPKILKLNQTKKKKIKPKQPKS